MDAANPAISRSESSKYRFTDIAVTYTASQFQGVYRGTKHHDEDFDDVLARAAANGCEKIILTTMTLEGARQNFEICQRHPDRCYMTIGIHPYHASELYDPPGQIESLAALADSLLAEAQPCLVAFGEIGLDYFYLKKAGKEIQRKAFVDQLEMATKLNLPLFLHVRDSYEDFVTLITPFLPRLPKRSVVHSFAGTKDEMLGLVELGFDISVNGVSFGTPEQLQMVEAIPLDRLHLETDSPWCEIPTTGPVVEYLNGAPPLPPSRKSKQFIRGQMVKGRNESCTIDRVARIVAGVKGLPLGDVVDVTWRNSVTVFGLSDSRGHT